MFDRDGESSAGGDDTKRVTVANNTHTDCEFSVERRRRVGHQAPAHTQNAASDADDRFLFFSVERSDCVGGGVPREGRTSRTHAHTFRGKEMSLCTSREFSVTVSPGALPLDDLHDVRHGVREANVVVQMVRPATGTGRPNQRRSRPAER